MSKKFDVVIGNPPYQEEATGGGTRDTPVYHHFMDAAYQGGIVKTCGWACHATC
ncbi:Eco57I restriction-modification methylase domain-containing protein [Propioniciclava sp. MC1683]|uniref:Eco57I restriction-modification methylase domain-containing protein n=1 Tax=Propioniciclava sp. MC1683 TaxID=2760309 RepID=UPI002814D83E|nr:Eco57I restriction-modification methylase domain-containing protein [Propioniciclava sp. MC1683]